MGLRFAIVHLPNRVDSIRIATGTRKELERISNYTRHNDLTYGLPAPTPYVIARPHGKRRLSPSAKAPKPPRILTSK